MEQIVNYIANANLPYILILLIAFLAPFMENIFPPAPGDSILVLLGAFVGLGKVDFISILAVSSLGSVIGFILMFLIGRYFGDKIIDSNRFKFINEKNMRKPRMWFHKYGYLVIVVNRFLSGTRAVISFLAGMSGMRLRYSMLLAALSSILWNGLLIYLGKIFGDNWREVFRYVEHYGLILLPIALIFFGYLIYKFIKDTDNNENEDTKIT